MSSPLHFILEEINNTVFRNVNKAIHFAHGKIDEKTPELSWKLLSSNEVIPAKLEWNTIIAEVVNRAPHAEIVEFGRWKVMNYHKYTWKGFSGKRTVIRTGQGARMFSLTKDKDAGSIQTILES